MNSLKIYTTLLRLYPRKHQKRYGMQMQQMVEDMLENATPGTGRLSVWIRIITDLPSSLYKEHIQVIGENMQTKDYGPKIGVIISALAALIGIGFPLYNRQAAAAFNPEALRLPTPMNGFLLPSLALVIVGVSLLVSKMHSQNRLSARYVRLSGGIATVAIINIMILIFDLIRR
jgi:hypothetical protein